MTTRPEDVAWRRLPMRHADPLEVHPLRTEGRTSVLLARFGAGWARRASVRCAAAEEFVVLDGAIEVNGSLLAAGSVAHIPAGAVRATTTSVEGCTAVAWFVGPPRWEDADQGTDPGPVLTWHPWHGEGGTDWTTPLALWSRLAVPRPAGGRQGSDTVDLDDRAWTHESSYHLVAHPPGHRVLRRTPHDG